MATQPQMASMVEKYGQGGQLDDTADSDVEDDVDVDEDVGWAKSGRGGQLRANKSSSTSFQNQSSLFLSLQSIKLEYDVNGDEDEWEMKKTKTSGVRDSSLMNR